jgi:hypothetical protein
MVTSEELSSLVTGLHAARHFEQAALITLRALLLIAEQALEASPFARKGRILRGVVHLRPADAYRRLVALEREAVETWPPSEALRCHCWPPRPPGGRWWSMGAPSPST